MAQMAFNNNLSEEREDVQFENLIQKRNQVKLSIISNKEQANRIVTRQIPVQLLALEWLNKIEASIETRAYLVENFLPILVLGCEKVLKEAQIKNLLSENKKDLNFNPINQLAQFLMRNNPKFNNSNETSAYVRTMREVYQELREQMFAFQENKLAKVKADVRKRRNERERIEKARELEMERRTLRIEDLFSNFHILPNGRIETEIVFQTLKTYEDYILRMPEKTRKSVQLKPNAWPSFCFNRNYLNKSKRLLKHEYAQVMNAFTDSLKSEYFDLFIEFIQQCASYYVNLSNRTILNRILIKLFNLMDTTNTGFLTRRRLIPIFDSFEKIDLDSTKSQKLASPFDFPLLDPYIKFENKLEELKPNLDLLIKEESNNTTIDLAFESAAAAVGPPPPPSQAQTEIAHPVTVTSSDETKTEANDTINTDEGSSVAEKAELDTSQLTNQIPEETASLNTTVNNNNINNNNESMNNNSNNNNDNNKSKSDPKYTYEQLYKPQPVKLDKKNELQFLKGGSFYFKPIIEQFHSFDTSLLKINPSYSVVTYDELTEFNTEFINARQFINMINNYLRGPTVFYNEKLINDLIIHIKDSYTENLAEKNLKLEKIANENKSRVLNEKYSASFDKMDNECSGQLEVDQIVNLFESYKDGLFKDYIEKALNELKPNIMLNNKPDTHISKDEFIKFLNDLMVAADLPKFQDQIMNLCMNSIQLDYNEKARGETRKKWLEQMKTIGDLTFGSLEPLYKHLFLVLLKDSENHGNSKNISAYVSILEKLDSDIVLKYHASTPHDSKYLLGKTLSQKTTNVSFRVIETGKSLLISRVQSDPNIHLFNPDNKNNGSFAIYPLKYTRNKTFGCLGIDTLQEKNKKNFFSDHELSFYQGVSSTFAKAYANIVYRNRLTKTITSAIEWLSQRCKNIQYYNVYAVQLLDNETRLVPDENNTDDNSKKSTKINLKSILKYIINKDDQLELLNNQTDDSLESSVKTGSCAYECAVTSESTNEYFNSRMSYSFPLRNEQHKTVFVVECVTAENFENNQTQDSDLEQIQASVYALHKCQEELLAENFLGIDKNKYELETQFEQDKFEILFEKQYLNFIQKKLEDLIDSIVQDANYELIRLVSDTVANKEFYSDFKISRELLSRINSFDPTLNVQFKRTESKLKLNSENVFKELSSLYIKLGKENATQRLFTDWCCLVKIIKDKSEKIRKNY